MSNVSNNKLKVVGVGGERLKRGRPSQRSLAVSSMVGLLDVFHRFTKHYSLDWYSFYALFKVCDEWISKGRGLTLFNVVMACNGDTNKKTYNAMLNRFLRLIDMGLLEVGYRRAVRGGNGPVNVYVPTVKLQTELDALIRVVNGL